MKGLKSNKLSFNKCYQRRIAAANENPPQKYGFAANDRCNRHCGLWKLAWHITYHAITLWQKFDNITFNF